MVAIAPAHHERGQFLASVILVQRHEGPHDHELGIVAVGQGNHGPVRRHAPARRADPEALVVDQRQARRTLAGPAGILGDRPLRGPLVEVLGVLDVVATPHLGLDPEQVLGVPQVLDQRRRHLRRRGEQAVEGRSVRSHQRIVYVHHVQHDLTGECVHRRLHRVPHVVEPVAEAAGPRQVHGGGELGIRIPVGGRVPVHHVDDPAIDQHRIRIGVEVQEGSQLLHPLSHVAHVEDA